MEQILQNLISAFSHAFVWRAFIVGILIALCASLLGVTLVLKRFSYISDGLSHIAFGVISVASVLNITVGEMWLVFPVTALCAILLLRRGKSAKTRGDAAIAMMSVGALAVGYLIMNVFPVSSNISSDVCITLFGSVSILTLTPIDVWMCLALAALVLGFFILFYNRIFSVTFDETFSKATGMNTEAYNLMIAVIIAAVIVLAMNLVGSLLVSALVVFPAMSAMRMFRSFRAVTLTSAVVAVFCALMGLLVSIVFGTPTGSSIVVVNIVVFGLSCLVGKVRSFA